MKVVKKLDIAAWRKRFECKTCESQLEIEAGDVKYEYHSGYGRDTDYETWTVRCPVCQTQHNVVKTDIPKAVQIAIKSKGLSSPGTQYVDSLDDGKQNPWNKGD